jgi:Trypsin
VKFCASLGAALVTVALAAPTPAVAIDEGVPDRAGHPNVGVLAADPDGAGPQRPHLWCSGSVVSDRVFLTAAHCIVAQPPETVWYVSLAAGSPATPIYTPALLGEDLPPFLVPLTRANEVVTHPRFGGFENRTHDLAVALFPANTFAGVEPVELPKAHQLERLDLGRKPIRLVGYGLDPEHGDEEPVFIGEGYRQTATAPFRRLTRRQLLLDGDAAATRKGGLCLADSGSPQLLPGTNLALSLHSENTNEVDACRGVLREQRLDTRSERRFLAHYLR